MSKAYVFVLASILLCVSVEAFAFQSISTRPTLRQPRVAAPSLPSTLAPRRAFRQSTAVASDLKEVKSASEPPAAPKKPSDSVLIAGLAFLSGWIDVKCLKLFGCYITMMTGPTLNVITTGLSGRLTDMNYNAAVIVAYCVGSMLYRVIENKRDGVKMARAVAPWLVISFVAADVLTLLDPASRLPGLVLATGYGLINCLSMGVTAVITCMLTGHIHRVAHACVDFSMGKTLTGGQMNLLTRSVLVLVPFMCGAFLGIVSRSSTFVASHQVLRGFTAVGCAYAALLWHHDRPVMQESEPRFGSNRFAT